MGVDSMSYNAGSFWEKIGKFGKKAGKEAIEQALVLFYVLQGPCDPDVGQDGNRRGSGVFHLPH